MTTTQDKLQAIRGTLRAQFVDRDDVIDGLLTALLADEHVLLLGPPGTAKSLLASAVCSALTDARAFSVLLSKTTVPDEIWGPIDLVAFDGGKFVRQVDNYLPSAHIAFLDEIWRGSSAILNGLLRAINERVYEHDGKLRRLPLRMVIAAANTLPESRDLDAMYDRFAVRFHVGRVKARGNRERLLRMKGTPSIAGKSISLDELDEARAVVNGVAVSDGIIDRTLAVWDTLAAAGHDVSERRWRQLVKLMRARAYIEGRDEVDPEDLSIVADSAWYDPKDRHGILATVLKVASPAVARAVELLDLAKTELTDIPKFDGKNDVAVATAAGKAKRRVAELLSDMQELEAQAVAGEVRRMRKVREEIAECKREAIRLTMEIVNA